VHNCGYGAGPKKIYETLIANEHNVEFMEVKGMWDEYWVLYDGLIQFQWKLERLWEYNGGYIINGAGRPLTIAADNAQFGQTGPRVGSFDGGYGASYMARIVGQKKAREIWFLCRFYNAKEAICV